MTRLTDNMDDANVNDAINDDRLSLALRRLAQSSPQGARNHVANELGLAYRGHHARRRARRRRGTFAAIAACFVSVVAISFWQRARGPAGTPDISPASATHEPFVAPPFQQEQALQPLQ